MRPGEVGVVTRPVLVPAMQCDKVAEAARKAARLYPGVVGEVLAIEILSLTQFSWLGGESSRAARLMHAVVEIEEGTTMNEENRP